MVVGEGMSAWSATALRPRVWIVGAVVVALVLLTLAILRHLPGVPGPGDPNYTAFSISFWAAIYSGLIYSVVTGLVVGGVVLWVQRAIDDRRFRHGCERELAGLKERLRMALDHPNPFVLLGDARERIIGSARAVADALSNQPLDMWWEHLPNHRGFLDLLRRHQRAVSSCVTTGDRLDIVLGVIFRRHSAERGAFLDNQLRGFYLGRLFDMSPEDIVPWLHVNKEELAWLQKGYELACKSPDVKRYSEGYLAAVTQVGQSTQALREALGQPGDTL
jgi:hypothetical protein